MKARFLPVICLLCSSIAFAGSDGSDLDVSNDQNSVGAPSEPVFGQQVTMTFVSGDKKFTTIDGGFYHVGDALADGAVVLDIESGNVLLRKQGVDKWIPMVGEPPQTSLSKSAQPVTPFGYIDVAIARLDTAIKNNSDRSGSQQLLDLENLRERLQLAKDKLDSGTLSVDEQAELESEINAEWLQSQQQLDALRDRINDSGRGLSTDDLIATRDILENAMLTALIEPLSKLNNSISQELAQEFAVNQSGDLLKTVTDLLGSYPDYQALVDKLEATQNKE